MCEALTVIAYLPILTSLVQVTPIQFVDHLDIHGSSSRVPLFLGLLLMFFVLSMLVGSFVVMMFLWVTQNSNLSGNVSLLPRRPLTVDPLPEKISERKAW